MAENLLVIRQNAYNAFKVKPPYQVTDNRRALQIHGPVPSLLDRERNFSLLVEQNFSGTGILDLSPNAWAVEKRNENVKAFKNLKKYALTEYGAVMIARILEDNKKNNTSETRFYIGIQDNDQARAGQNFILLPSDFPRLSTFPGTTQLVDPLAVIHHEFGHTKFDTRNSKPHMVSLQHERDAVIFHENPVRAINGMEPRYTYFKEGKTINIISGEIKAGLFTFSPNNPSILVRP